ncbi:Hypothetical protein SRAE_1000342600 [Strongyloides ratti]|uniref:Uncharacterized protein n=1 Tax=Strongyloides ratti TaxID=34506 RepID=A0A090LAM3_STRRB|nr:Hypothetical protein SRAE_1000342600 [Strongyloides ratti]CEF65173.1 Hypothetical protein SRAE_1000342600 [Strongyloides ratti]
MNNSYFNFNSNVKIPSSTTEFLDKGYWDTMEGQAIITAKRWAKDILISLTSVILLVTIIISISCIRAYIKSRNDALTHDPEDRWVKSMCLESKIPLMNSHLFEEQNNILILKVSENDDVKDLLDNMKKIESNHKNGTVVELTTEIER